MMYLGYQKNRIVSYTKSPIDKVLYNLDRIEETEKEYVLDGEEYVLKNEAWEEKQAQQEEERIAKLKLTKREVFLALYKDCGITPQQIKSGITDEEALIEFEYANEYYRGNPLITTIGSSLGYSKEQLDYLFENKSFEKPTVGGE
ncbi:MAG: hypothetical protein E7Z92_01850 [Cyanobacteria bacterium SIG31]|nr:hypothetical protein [Cyanobacteria bacterium SIG31]